MRTQSGRINYYKYDYIKERLEEELQTEQWARQIAIKLKIAVPTFHKYRSLLQLERGRQYIISDERAFMECLTIPPATAPWIMGAKLPLQEQADIEAATTQPPSQAGTEPTPQPHKKQLSVGAKKTQKASPISRRQKP